MSSDDAKEEKGADRLLTVEVDGHNVSPLLGREVEAGSGLLNSRVGDLKGGKRWRSRGEEMEIRNAVGEKSPRPPLPFPSLKSTSRYSP